MASCPALVEPGALACIWQLTPMKPMTSASRSVRLFMGSPWTGRGGRAWVSLLVGFVATGGAFAGSVASLSRHAVALVPIHAHRFVHRLAQPVDPADRAVLRQGVPWVEG